MGMGGNKKGFSSLKHLKQMKMIIIIFFLVLSGAVVLFYRWQATVLVLLLFLPLFAYNCTLFKNKVLETEKDKLASAMEKLRESARSYAMSLSNLPGMAYRCKYDRNWTMLFVSEGCFDLIGFKPKSLLNNRDISYNELIHPEYREQINDRWAEMLATRTAFRYEYPITTAAREEKWVFEQGRGVYDEQGKVIALEGLLIDISDIKKREEEIRYLNYHDSLTGLYNRRFLEEARKRLDCSRSVTLVCHHR